MSTTLASNPAIAAEVDRHAEFNKPRLFLISVLALITAGVDAILRGDISTNLEQTFLHPIDAATSGGMISKDLGMAFLGFAFSIAIGSPLLDLLGMGRLLMLSSLCFIVGTGVILATPHNPSANEWLYYGMLITGIGWGLVETVVNPLTATLYPKDKTSKLNILHAWWPGGLIIGGLFGVAVNYLHVEWYMKFSVVFLPALLFGILAMTTKFPKTERKAAGISGGEMFKQLGKPLFIILFLSMFLTAASELAPGQWVNFALSDIVGFPGTLILVYISGIMFIMRFFAGPLAHRMGPVGVLWFSCLLAAFGLYFLSHATSAITAILAATVWGTGVCYMWPTMLALSSERFPRGGALLMGLMGTAGTLSIAFFLPQMGSIYDTVKIDLANNQEPKSAPVLMFDAIDNGVMDLVRKVTGHSPSAADEKAAEQETAKRAAAFTSLETSAKGTGPESAASQSKLAGIKMQAGAVSFRAVAILPALLLVVFGLIWLYDRMRGGYRQEHLSHEL